MAQDNTAADDRQATGPTEVFASGWWGILKRIWSEAGKEDLGLIASGIVFNAFRVVMPMPTAVVLIYSIVAAPEQVARHIAAKMKVR